MMKIMLKYNDDDGNSNKIVEIKRELKEQKWLPKIFGFLIIPPIVCATSQRPLSIKQSKWAEKNKYDIILKDGSKAF